MYFVSMAGTDRVKTIHISTLVEPNQMNMGFVITNDKASYVGKEDCICLLALPKKTGLN